MIDSNKKIKVVMPLLIAVLLFIISAKVTSNVGREPQISESFSYIFDEELESKAEESEETGLGISEENLTPKYSELLMNLTSEIPILLYQHIDEINVANTIVSPAIFEEHIVTLIDNGYTGVSFDEIIDYVEGNGELPEKPIIITFDDGYLSTYEYAFPILKKYNMKATAFIIGISVGKNTYRDTENLNYGIISRFNYEQAREMTETGLITIQSHSYDMHQWSVFEETLGNEYRDGAMPLLSESEEEYKKNFKKDFDSAKRELENELNTKMIVYAYPHSKYTYVTEEVLREMGVKATVTLDHGSNDIIKGQPDTLYDLSRMAITAVSGKELLKTLNINRVVINYEDGADKVLPRNMRWMLK